MAVRVIAAEHADHGAFRTRFAYEARTAASLEHPHVVTVYDAGEDAGTSTSSCAWSTAASRRSGSRARPLGPRLAVELVTQVADALDAAHAAGLVHRDVKPANILVASAARGRARAYLTDLGLAKLAGSAGLTWTGEWLGTLDYGRQSRSAPSASTAAPSWAVGTTNRRRVR
jgi:serine/threonine protein kinase